MDSQRAGSSLRRRVAVWLLPPLFLLLAINAVLSFRGAMDAANFAYDRSLRASIQSIGEHSYVRGGRIVVDIPFTALEIFSEGAQERVFYAVVDPEGRLLTGYPDLPALQPVPNGGELRTADAVYNGDAVRIGAMRKRLYDPSGRGDDSILVVVAETTETRTDLAWQLFFDSLRRQLLLVGVGVVLVLAALSSAFRPLLRLRDTIRRRAEEDLTPISLAGVPSEIRPLIEAINHHMTRLSEMLEARKRFLADAAHQLRTPLTVLGAQADYGLRQEAPAEMRRTLEGIGRSVRSARRLTNQMLSLSRAEAANGLISERGRFDLVALVREVALELGPLAIDKRIDLAYEGAQPGVVYVEGNESMLREMVSNVVDNAVRYTPEGGLVVVTVRTAPSEATLVVRDNGPGVPLSERDKVFRRFYRCIEQDDTEGSGLGLSIAREACLTHGGRIGLGDGIGGRGLTVEIHLPVVA